MKYLHLILTVAIVGFVASYSFAQENDRDRGIDLFKQGKNKEAVKVLQRASKRNSFQNDPEVWNYLGVALINLGDVINARKSLIKATELDPKSSLYKTNLAESYRQGGYLTEAKRTVSKAIELDDRNSSAILLQGFLYLYDKQFDLARQDVDKVIQLDKNFSAAYTLNSRIFVEELGNRMNFGSKMPGEYELLKKAADTLEYCLNHCQNNADAAVQREKFETLSRFYGYYSAGGKTGMGSTPDDTHTIVPAKLLSHGPAQYSTQARNAGINGKISVYALLEANGRIDHVIVLNGLGFGLDEQAIQAAKQIKFIPAMEAGKPITRAVHLEYTFDIY